MPFAFSSEIFKNNPHTDLREGLLSGAFITTQYRYAFVVGSLCGDEKKKTICRHLPSSGQDNAKDNASFDARHCSCEELAEAPQLSAYLKVAFRKFCPWRVRDLHYNVNKIY